MTSEAHTLYTLILLRAISTPSRGTALCFQTVCTIGHANGYKCYGAKRSIRCLTLMEHAFRANDRCSVFLLTVCDRRCFFATMRRIARMRSGKF